MVRSTIFDMFFVIKQGMRNKMGLAEFLWHVLQFRKMNVKKFTSKPTLWKKFLENFHMFLLLS